MGAQGSVQAACSYTSGELSFSSRLVRQATFGVSGLGHRLLLEILEG